MVGVTYEHDWYTSDKDVIVAGYTFSVKMKYSSEFYQKIDTNMPSSATNVNGKGFVRIQKTPF